LRLIHLQSNDLFEIREHEISEIALLHVAITRVIKSLTMPSYGKPYKFLLLREWGILAQINFTYLEGNKYFEIFKRRLAKSKISHF
jgi:hypothetical protein